jgi:acyl-CoA synthetase (AMP-forming)/AMP-acid ligase II
VTLSGYRTLIEPVIERAKSDPHRTTLLFVNENGSSDKVTISQFHNNAEAYALALKRIGICSEDLVILVLRHSQVLLSAFWGALYIGAIPSIFPFLTEKLDPDIYMERIYKLVSNSGARVIITFPDFKENLEKLLDGLNCQILSTQDVPDGGFSDGETEFWLNPSGDKIAFLQHSSGTTGLQKGVALSHQAVLNQIIAYSEVINLSPDDVIVSWLPLYHDMGLIAGFVMPIVAGIPLVLISPFHWVRSPVVLLKAIDEYRGTLSWLPNFAYNHLVRTIRERDLIGLDLSHWRAVINCSEPVRNDSHQIFLERFMPFQFQLDALATCYAMAENTFAVTQSTIGSPPHVDWVNVRSLQEELYALPTVPNTNGSTPVVSCGYPIQGTEINIVNKNGAKLPERQVGEIVVRGNCMLDEYYHRPEITNDAIRHGWYYTGDMGYQANGQLYVSGRKKDLIIVGGKNIYPQDLEAIANEVPGIYPGRAVTFGLMDEILGSEIIVMVCELQNVASSDEKRRIEQALRRKVVQQTEVTLSDVRLVEKRWLIKTSSGKIARVDNREKYIKDFIN